MSAAYVWSLLFKDRGSLYYIFLKYHEYPQYPFASWWMDEPLLIPHYPPRQGTRWRRVISLHLSVSHDTHIQTRGNAGQRRRRWASVPPRLDQAWSLICNAWHWFLPERVVRQEECWMAAVVIGMHVPGYPTAGPYPENSPNTSAGIILRRLIDIKSLRQAVKLG